LNFTTNKPLPRTALELNKRQIRRRLKHSPDFTLAVFRAAAQFYNVINFQNATCFCHPSSNPAFNYFGAGHRQSRPV